MHGGTRVGVAHWPWLILRHTAPGAHNSRVVVCCHFRVLNRHDSGPVAIVALRAAF